MIIFGGMEIAPYLFQMEAGGKFFVLNFFNPANVGTRLDKLWPPKSILEMCPIDSVAFDRAYATYLLQDDEAFQDFMEILMAVYYNGDVFVLTDFNSPPVVIMYESIIKLIQCRYGYNCYIANCPEDIKDIPISEMSDIGFQIFIQDKERYTRLSVDAKQLLQNIELVGGENDRCI